MLVSFYYKNYGDNDASFQVGFSTTTKDPEAFDWGKERIYTTAEWQKSSFYCPEGTKYVAIKWTGGALIYMDDFIFTVGTPPSVPHDIAAANITAYSADLSWSGDTEL